MQLGQVPRVVPGGREDFGCHCSDSTLPFDHAALIAEATSEDGTRVKTTSGADSLVLRKPTLKTVSPRAASGWKPVAGNTACC
ncbi:MAG: hypothetical protein Ct9H300mP1_34620 [Planctomycetaceae bacterium]|nr:MAG: hypothetical protein Ct9H300mP1_34620 [Planctomycetaceae bacterium]